MMGVEIIGVRIFLEVIKQTKCAYFATRFVPYHLDTSYPRSSFVIHLTFVPISRTIFPGGEVRGLQHRARRALQRCGCFLAATRRRLRGRPLARRRRSTLAAAGACRHRGRSQPGVKRLRQRHGSGEARRDGVQARSPSLVLDFFLSPHVRSEQQQQRCRRGRGRPTVHAPSAVPRRHRRKQQQQS